MTIAYPDACGIDIGSRSHFVAVPADRCDEPMREFAAFTEDLTALVQWLRECRVTAVAPEAAELAALSLDPAVGLLDQHGDHMQHAVHVEDVSSCWKDFYQNFYLSY